MLFFAAGWVAMLRRGAGDRACCVPVIAADERGRTRTNADERRERQQKRPACALPRDDARKGEIVGCDHRPKQPRNTRRTAGNSRKPQRQLQRPSVNSACSAAALLLFRRIEHAARRTPPTLQHQNNASSTTMSGEQRDDASSPQAAWRAMRRSGCPRSDPLDAGAVPKSIPLYGVEFPVFRDEP
jgi:hypothetical protein